MKSARDYLCSEIALVLKHGGGFIGEVAMNRIEELVEGVMTDPRSGGELEGDDQIIPNHYPTEDTCVWYDSSYPPKPYRINFRDGPGAEDFDTGKCYATVEEADVAARYWQEHGIFPPSLDDMSCKGCGRVDPCGEHYTDCTLLEPGDTLIERGTEKAVGFYDGPDLSGLYPDEEA